MYILCYLGNRGLEFHVAHFEMSVIKLVFFLTVVEYPLVLMHTHPLDTHGISMAGKLEQHRNT